MELNNIPSEVIEHIKDYLWGNVASQQHQLDIVEQLDTYPQQSLHADDSALVTVIAALRAIQDKGS